MSQHVEAFSTASCITCHKQSGKSGASIESSWIWAKDHLKTHPRHRIVTVLEAEIVQVNENEKSAWANLVTRLRQEVRRNS